MRQIKFRAWNKTTIEMNKYVEIYCHKDGSTGFSAGNENNNPIGNSENFELMQFTGLKDKNGVDIYESDLVKRVANMRDYSDADGIEELIYEVNYSGIDLLPFSETGVYMEEYEVIGNIHENKELLNK